MSLVITNAEVGGRRCDLRIDAGRAVMLGGRRVPTAEFLDRDLVVDAHGAACLPGLHDHHVHLLASAAVSVDVTDARNADQFAALLRTEGEGWVRAHGYHESIAGPLDRHALDRLCPDRPLRLQHRSGALWMLNSAALHEVGPTLDHSDDVERDTDGTPNGRLWRYDARLRTAVPPAGVELAALGERLLGLGITGVTDATPDLEPTAIELLSTAHADGLLPQRIVLLGAPDGWTPPVGSALSTGPAKLLLRDHDLPPVEEIAIWIQRRHRHGRPVAVHCVSADSLVLTLAALDLVGALDGDRIEHAGVVPSGLRPDLARLGVRVVTQPDFLRTRGDDYARDVEPDELPFLYPFASLLAEGVPVAASSDAPFGHDDPWQVVASAATRQTSTGRILGEHETVPVQVALDGYLGTPDTPGGAPRTIKIDAAGDVCLLRRPLADALAAPDAGLVRLSAVGGRVAAIE